MGKWLISGILFSCEEKENVEIWRTVNEFVKQLIIYLYIAIQLLGNFHYSESEVTDSERQKWHLFSSM